MDQVTHGPLAVQQRPGQLRKAFLPYVYISALSIFTPWENTQFSVAFVPKGEKTARPPSIHPSHSIPAAGQDGGQGGQVSCFFFMCTKKKKKKKRPGTPPVQPSAENSITHSLTHSLLSSSAQVSGMNRSELGLSFIDIHTHGQFPSRVEEKQTK